MTISFKTSTGGTANYILNGKKTKPRNHDLVEVIDGNLEMSEKIANSNKFHGEYYTVVLSVEKKISNDEMKSIYDGFKKELFVGLKEDEYNISAAIHQDTDYTHIHAIIPKQNLLTNQHLQLYMHGIDTKRMDLIADDLAIKHGLKTKEELKPTINKVKEYSFEKQREERNQEPFKFKLTTKIEKALAQQQVTELIKTNIDYINSVDDIKDLIHNDTDLRVVKADFDRTKKQHYITIQDTNSKKTKITGDLFSDDFFKQSKDSQKEQLNLNSKTFTDVEREAYAKKVRAALKREREKRFKLVSKKGRALKLELRKDQRRKNNKIKRMENDIHTTTISRSRKTTTRKPRSRDKVLNNIRKDEKRVSREIEEARRRRVIRNGSSREQVQQKARTFRERLSSKFTEFRTRIAEFVNNTRQYIKDRIKGLTNIAENTELKRIDEEYKKQKATLSLPVKDFINNIEELEMQYKYKATVNVMKVHDLPINNTEELKQFKENVEKIAQIVEKDKDLDFTAVLNRMIETQYKTKEQVQQQEQAYSGLSL